MELTDLEICNRIADIEGVKVKSLKWSFELVFYEKKPFELSEYNPLTDKALNCELRDKHDVMIDYSLGHAWKLMDDGFICFGFKSKEDIPRAVLLCIIEAKAND